MSDTNTVEYKKKEIPAKVGTIGWGLLVVGLLAAAATFMLDKDRGSFNSLIVFMFLTSVGIGSLFWIAVEYAAGAVWLTPVRRIPEILASIIPFLVIFSIPMILNMGNMYEWTHTHVMLADPMLKSKMPYLNKTAFFIRLIIVFGGWFLFYKFLTGNSRKQDETKDQSLTTKNIKLGIAFIPFFAFSLTVTAIDWVMSLQPHWFSTMFGVYYFAGTAWCALAVNILIMVFLKEKGYLPKSIVNDHYYSLGALMFAFTVFWAYIAFSQFLIIYSANIPEETFWYLFRWDGKWKTLSLALIILHFIIPFFALLSRPAKINPKRLVWVSMYVIFVHMYDLYWLIMPVFNQEHPVFGWMEIGFMLIPIGFIIVLFTMKAKNTNLIPVGDPKLQRGLNFRL